MYNSLTKY